MEMLGGGRKDSNSKVKPGFCLVLFHCVDRGGTVIQSNRAAVQKPPPFKMRSVERCGALLTLDNHKSCNIWKSAECGAVLELRGNHSQRGNVFRIKTALKKKKVFSFIHSS